MGTRPLGLGVADPYEHAPPRLRHCVEFGSFEVKPCDVGVPKNLVDAGTPTLRMEDLADSQKHGIAHLCFQTEFSVRWVIGTDKATVHFNHEPEPISYRF